MAKKRAVKTSTKKTITLDFGEISEPQRMFMSASSFFICYGGAKGGGKSNDELSHAGYKQLPCRSG